MGSPPGDHLAVLVGVPASLFTQADPGSQPPEQAPERVRVFLGPEGISSKIRACHSQRESWVCTSPSSTPPTLPPHRTTISTPLPHPELKIGRVLETAISLAHPVMGSKLGLYGQRQMEQFTSFSGNSGSKKGSQNCLRSRP